MRSTLSLIGIYQYDNTILDELLLPSNFETGALAQLKDNILIETAELEILYPEPSFLKYAIGQWCKKHFKEWEHLRNTELYEYNPIWNADYTITDNTLETRDLTKTNDTDSSTEIKNHTNVRSGDDTITHSVYSYNDTDTGVPSFKDKTDYNSRNTENGKTEYANDQTDTDTGTINTDYSRELHGNYGQTTTQQMIEEERKLAMFNLYDYIINQFKERFCLLVY